MLNKINNYTIWLMLTILITSCSSAQEKRNDKPTNSVIQESNIDIVKKLKNQQESAFDALNTIQTSTDEKNRLYSTYANSAQPCNPADTSFVITQTELLVYMKQFVSKHCQNLNKKRRNELAEASVLAQSEYTVLFCARNSLNVNFENGHPMMGTWVIPNVLGQRDVVMVW